MNVLRGFAPDLPTTTPGIIVDCTSFVPYESGMRAADTASSYSDALAAECRGAATLTLLDGSRRVFAGTSTKLYELSGTSWSDVSDTGDYSLGTDSRWVFTQFGDTSLASAIDHTIQYSTSSGDFDAISGAPKAVIVESVLTSGGGFVMAFNTIDSDGTFKDGWHCSEKDNALGWTPSVATQCAKGRLLGTEGPLTAGKKFGDDLVVAYKSRSLYMGQYVGPPGVWAWKELPGYGCVGPDAVANLGTAHFVVGEDDIYIYDGVRPIPVASDVRQWFFDNSSGTYRNRTIVVFDRDKDVVRIHFPSSGSGTGTPDRCLVYHLKTQQWGRDDMTIEAALLFNTPTVTFDADTGTFDGGSAGTYDEIPPGSKIVAIFNSSHVLQTLNGDPGSTSFTLHDVGDDSMVSRITGNMGEEVMLRYMTQPTSASVSAFSSMATGGSLTSGATQSAHEVPASGFNRFPFRATGRWHRLSFSFTGDCKVTGYKVPLKPAGLR